MSSPEGFDEPPRHSARKLEARRASRRRRRRRATGVAIAVVAVAAAVLLRSALAPNHHYPAAVGLPSPGERVVLEKREGWKLHPGPVPILMYLRLETARGGDYGQLYVPAKLFRAQMRALRRRGFTAVTMNDVTRAWRGDGLLPAKPVVLTFDDGYRSQYTVAYPTLRRYRWPGVLYLVPSNTRIVSGPTVAQVRRMLAAGWELGSHTIHHRDLRTLRGDALTAEVTGARAVLRRMFGGPVNSFCYPGGDYDADAIAAVRRAGYTSATTVAPGLASRAKPYELDRIRVDDSDSPAVLLSTISSGRRP